MQRLKAYCKTLRLSRRSCLGAVAEGEKTAEHTAIYVKGMKGRAQPPNLWVTLSSRVTDAPRFSPCLHLPITGPPRL